MIVLMPVSCLSLHAGYRCRHAGACCRTWTVEAEPHVLQVVSSLEIRRAGVEGPLFLPAGQGAGWRAARDHEGRCVFFDEDRGRICMIHEAAGPEALPTACRHFPRVVLRDPRGTFISLSHFCPTAASLLLDSARVAVVRAQAPLTVAEPVEGLDARDALPPLLRPGILTDLEGYDAWERAGLSTLGRGDVTWAQALALIDAATADVRRWRPGSESLADRVKGAFRSAVDGAPGPDAAWQEAASLHEATMDRIRAVAGPGLAEAVAPIDDFEAHWTRLVAPAFGTFDRAMKNYLAARLFGNWIAYQGQGLRSIVEWLRASAALVRHHAVKGALEGGSAADARGLLEAVRLADLVLLHGLDTQAFARRASVLEQSRPGRPPGSGRVPDR